MKGLTTAATITKQKMEIKKNKKKTKKKTTTTTADSV